MNKQTKNWEREEGYINANNHLEKGKQTFNIFYVKRFISSYTHQV
jgi:hypothetical protein